MGESAGMTAILHRFQRATEVEMKAIHTIDEIFEALRCCSLKKAGMSEAKEPGVLHAGDRWGAETEVPSIEKSE